jgi:dipeptidyl aminopeptidase/acylaminoacyl peptidase
MLNLIILLLFLVSGSLSQSFTLEDILSFPYPTNLTSASKVDRIAWVFNEQGVRNVWTAAAPNFKPVKLTNYTEDDGQPISGLKLTSDGSIIVYVRGGNPNRKGEHPNPTSDPDGAEQAIWAIRTDGGKPWKLGNGNNPVISPSDNMVLFTRNGKIYITPLIPRKDVGEDKFPKLLFKARGRNGNPQWSPDGRYIAFVSNRGDHSFIGIYDRQRHKIKWIAPSVDRDMLPVWSPDGKKIAFIRMPGLKKHELRNITAGYPFSIWIADVETGEAKEIWRSPGKDGGFAQWYPAHPLRWTSNNKILFYSEHDGWLHIYSISPNGGKAVDLTPGKSETEHSGVSPDGKFLYYSSNKGDVDRRHIWKVSTEGGRPIQLTKGTGIETDPVPLASGKYIAFLSATARRPQAIAIMNSNGGKFRIIAPEKLPERFPIDKLVIPQQVKFKASDGLVIHGQLFLPKDAKPGDKRPAVIFLHGGPIRQMLLGWHYRGYYAKAYALNQYLVSKGYIVLSINFRSGIGYGREFRQAKNQGPRGASEYKDVIAGAIYLRGRPEVDPNKIGLWGGSYGGYLTALALARDSDLFAAGVDLHGVHDWSFRATDFSPGGGWGIQGDQLLELAYKSSPVADLSLWSSPILLIHGDDDRNVLFAQTTDLVQRLREKNVHVEVLVFPDEVHSFLRHESWLKAYKATAEFFDKFLK